MLTSDQELEPLTALSITVAPGGLHISGEIDAANCDVLRQAIAVADAGPITLDMSEVAFMDSSGIGVLISSFKERNEGVVIVHPSEPVERLLQLTGLYQRFVGTPES